MLPLYRFKSAWIDEFMVKSRKSCGIGRFRGPPDGAPPARGHVCYRYERTTEYRLVAATPSVDGAISRQTRRYSRQIRRYRRRLPGPDRWLVRIGVRTASRCRIATSSDVSDGRRGASRAARGVPQEDRPSPAQTHTPPVRLAKLGTYLVGCAWRVGGSALTQCLP